MVLDDLPEQRWNRPQVLEECGGGLVSTAHDYLAFATALLAGGGSVLSRASVSLMTSDHLPAEVRAVSGFRPGYFATTSYGFGVGVQIERTHLGPSAGSYGWNGFYGTYWNNDPAAELTTLLFTQVNAPPPSALMLDVWTAAYQSLQD